MDDRQLSRGAKRVRDAMSRRSALRKVGAGGLAAGAAIGGNRHAADAQFSFTTAATEAAARRAISAINGALDSGNTSGLDTAFAPGYANRTPRRSLATGQTFAADLAGLKASVAELRVLVPDGVILVDDILAAGDTAAVRGTFRGTLDPAAVGVPAGMDPRLRIGGLAFARIEAGLIAESWEYDEAAGRYGAIAQGVAPQPTPPPTEEPVTDDGRGEVRDVRDFEAVSLQGVGTLLITQGDAESLSIQAEPRVLNRIETEVIDGTLFIRPDRSFSTRDPIVYSLTVDNLAALELSGAGEVEIPRLDTAQLRLLASGAGMVTIDELTADLLEVEASGNVALTIGGTVDSQSISVSGAGTYDATNLASRLTAVTVDSAAQAIVQVSERLEATASGASSVAYIGDPEVSESTSGVGSVTKTG
ncbi:MAG: DUF2807 domain-containing protein [Chloroflexia bacterium]|nr:DUF2807 domain-containing protein [Chloroflexia bacterium]